MTANWNHWGSASYHLQSEHIAGPLREGAARRELELSEAGHFVLTGEEREPMVLLELARSLGTDYLQVNLVRNPEAEASPLPALTFAAYSEFGAALPVDVPPTDPVTRRPAPASYALQLTLIRNSGDSEVIAPEQLPQWIKVVVVEGIMGRVNYLIAAEPMRLRRICREVQAMRRLALARDSALDRVGAALAVPRFSDDIAYDNEREEIITRTVDEDGLPLIEPDSEYRQRLGLYQPWMKPTRSHLLNALNGKDDAAGPNQGLLSASGFESLFQLVERDNPFAVAVHLLETGTGNLRVNFLQHLRDIYLLAPTQALEEARFLSSVERARQAELRTQITQGFNFNDSQFIAPQLAHALARMAACRRALLGDGGGGGGVGVAPVDVLRAQSDDHGSRYELGLGIDIPPLAAGEVTALRDAVLDPARPPAEDLQTEGLLRQMQTLAEQYPDDPLGLWLFQACGIRTAHHLGDAVYLSHLPTGGLKIEGSPSVGESDQTLLNARYLAAGDVSGNVRLNEGLVQAAEAWNTAGMAAWSLLSATDAETAWGESIDHATGKALLADAGFQVSQNEATLAERLGHVPAEMVATVALDNGLANEITSGDSAAIARLGLLKEIFSDAGFSAMLPLIGSSGQVVLALGVIGLPIVGSNLAARRASGFRWYGVPIYGGDSSHRMRGQLGAIGSSTTFRSSTGGALCAVVAVGYARDPARTDPYEFRVELEDGAMLNLKQYEYVMNLLSHLHPVGIEVNTWQLRQRHVDLDNDGVVDALPPNIARTYRQFRRPRHRGEFGVEAVVPLK